MGILAERFTKYLEEKQLLYNYKKIAVPGTNDEHDCVQIVFAEAERPAFTVNFIFDDDSREVHVRVIDIIPKIEKDRRAETLEAVNGLNMMYNHGKFCVTEEGLLELRFDALLCKERSADFCYELLRKALKICVESYERFCRI